MFKRKERQHEVWQKYLICNVSNLREFVLIMKTYYTNTYQTSALYQALCLLHDDDDDDDENNSS